jgi:hypothetical protein
MMVYYILALIAIALLATFCSHSFGGLKGTVILVQLFIIAAMIVYKFIEGGPVYLMLLGFGIPFILVAIAIGLVIGSRMSKKS